MKKANSIIFLTHISLYFIIPLFISGSILTSFLILFVGLLFSFIVDIFISAMIKNGADIMIFTVSGIFSTFQKMKKVNHSKLGQFYLHYSKRSNSFELYKIHPLYLKTVLSIDNHENIDLIIKDINKKLDNIYKDELDKINKINNTIEKISKWDGYLDTETRRDSKINKIVK